MTKNELNTKITNPPTAWQLKRTKLEDLQQWASRRPLVQRKRVLKAHTYCQPVSKSENIT